MKSRSAQARQPLFGILFYGFGVLPLQAAEPTYYECIYPEISGVDAWPPAVRFMLDIGRKRGFRIDTPTSRPVQIYLSAKDITLMDFQQYQETSLITIRHDGESVYSRHRLSGPSDGEGRPLSQPLGEQFFGHCSPAHETALGTPWDSRLE